MKKTLLVLLLLSAVQFLLAAPSQAVTWNRLASGGFNSVAVAPPPIPGSPNLVYAGFLGDNVSGPSVVVSEDSGATWTATALPYRCNSISALPSTPGRVYAATDNGLFVTADYGASWTLLEGTIRSWIAVNTGNDNILYGDARRSLDGGLTWSGVPQNLSRNFHLKVTPADPSFLVRYDGSSATVSHNAGDNWAMLPSGSGGFYSVEADPVDAQYYYVGYCNYMTRFYPGGSARPFVDGDIDAFAVDPAAHNKVFISAQGSFFYSDDFGYTWVRQTSPGGISLAGRMIIDNTTGTIYVPTWTGLFAARTADFPPLPVKTQVGAITVGKYQGTTFVASDRFMPGEQVVFRTNVSTQRTGAPLSGATVTFDVNGISLASDPSDANGAVEIRWTTTRADLYGAHVTNVTIPGNYAWNGVNVYASFTVGRIAVANVTAVGKYLGTTFVPMTDFTVGEEVVIRTTITDTETGVPLSGVTVDISIIGDTAVDVTSAPSNASGIAEARWTATRPYAWGYYAYASIPNPPAGYLDTGGGYGAGFNVTASAKVRNLVTGTYQTILGGTTFVKTTNFKAGNPVTFRATVVDAAGTAIPDAYVTFSLRGPSAVDLVSNLSDAAGIEEINWDTTACTKGVPGTPKGSYRVKVTDVVLPGGYTWNRVVPSANFTLK